MNLWDYMEVVVVDGIPAIFIFRSSWAIEIGQCKKQEGFFCFFVKHMCILPAPWPDLKFRGLFVGQSTAAKKHICSNINYCFL